MNHKISIAGHFHLVKRKRDGRVTFKSGKCGNLITNLGLDYLGVTTSSAFTGCVVGSGSSTPSFGDQWLDTFVARTTSRMGAASWSFHNEDPVFFVRSVTRWQFGEGVAAGNLSEIGMSWGAATGTLFCRALIVDSMGNPTTITVLPDEFLEVTYTHEYYLSTDDDVGQVTLDGNVYDYVCRFGGVFNDWSASGTASNLPNTIRFAGSAGPPSYQTAATDLTPMDAPLNSGTTLNAGTVTRFAYVPGSYEFIVTADWSLSQGNSSGGIRRIVYDTMRAWGASAANHNLQFKAQCGFVPPIPKDNTKVLSLTFRTSWGRHE